MHQHLCSKLHAPTFSTASPPAHLQGAFAQLAAAGGGAAQPAAAAGEGGSAAAAADTAAPAAPAVKNLGVVGRGTKRINLQPVQVLLTGVPGRATLLAGG